MQFDVGAFVSGLGGITLGGILAGLFLRNLFAEIRDLRNAVRDLEERRLGTLEARLANVPSDGRVTRLEADIQELKANCVGERVATSLSNLESWMNKIDGRFQVTKAETDKQHERIKSNRAYVENLDTTFQKHRDDREIHGG